MGVILIELEEKSLRERRVEYGRVDWFSTALKE